MNAIFLHANCNKIITSHDMIISMDPKQWQALVRQQTPLVWQTVYRIVAHYADASDCFQEVFVQAWEISVRQAIENWPGLLQRLATARAIDLLRKRKNRSKRIDSLRDSSQIASDETGPLANVQSAELANQLRFALAELPAQQSEIYCLRHLNHLSYEQIADELGLTTSVVGVNLHRATQRLRAALAEVIENPVQRGQS